MNYQGTILVLLFASNHLLAQELLKLDDLVREALDGNPEITAAQKRYEAMRQKPRQESALPDPMVSLGYNSSGYPWPGAGLGREPIANIGMMMTQEFPYPGKRRLKGQIAAKEADAEFQQYQAVQLSVLTRVKQAFYRLHHTYETEDLLLRSRDLLQKLLKISEIRYSAGKAMQQDVFKTQTQLSVLEIKLVQNRRERASREAEIITLLNRPADSTLPRPVEPHLREEMPSLESLYAAAGENSPMLKREEKMIQRAELAVNLARKDFFPDYAITGGYFNMGSMPDMYMFRADIKLPLYFFRKQRAASTEQSYNLTQSRRTYESTGRSLQLKIKDDYLMAQASLQLMHLYSQTVIPQASLALESSLASYEAGTADFMPVFMNFMTAIDYEMNYHEEMESFHVALARLEEMTGLQLTE
jgi:outer membrane protein TolC